MYIPASVVKQHWDMNKSRPLNFAGADEAELEKALKASMATFEAEDRANGGANPDDEGGMVGSVLNRGGAGGAKEEEKKFTSFAG